MSAAVSRAQRYSVSSGAKRSGIVQPNHVANVAPSASSRWRSGVSLSDLAVASIGESEKQFTAEEARPRSQMLWHHNAHLPLSKEALHANSQGHRPHRILRGDSAAHRFRCGRKI